MMIGTMGVLWLNPVFKPRSLASCRNCLERACTRATRSGSSSSKCSEASAAAAFEGGMPTLYTNPGAVYLRYSISSLQPAMYPPQLPKDLLSVPIQMSTSRGSTFKMFADSAAVAPHRADRMGLVHHQ